MLRAETYISNFAVLVTHKTSLHLYPHVLLILHYNFSIFPVLLVALMVCIVMVVIHMPNDRVCQFKSLREMQIWLKTLILMGKSSKWYQIRSDCRQNETNSKNLSYILTYNLVLGCMEFNSAQYSILRFLK